MTTLARSLLFVLTAGAAVAIAPACGGGTRNVPEGPREGEEPVGQSAGETEEGGEPAEGEPGMDGGVGGEVGTEGETGTTGTVEEGPPPVVTFVLKNSSETQELAFNMDLGWQPNLFAYTGKPPRAVSILMFPKFCTASCDMPAAERCPTCPQPEKAKDILAAQKMEKVAPGSELEVPWDGKIFLYERGRGKGKQRCDCHRTEDAPAGTYTVKACGLRLTTTAEERSKLQCVEGEMTLPADEPIRVELDFGAPAAPSKAKKKKKKR
jgi:hypothetical protein